MSDEGRLVAGRYRLERRIGSGAMGVVWLAHDERLNRPVAVKKLLLPPGLPEDEAEEAVARCMREGRIAAKLHHPNAIAVFDAVDEDGVPILIMEYLPSVSLAIALSEQGPMDVAEVARIGAQVASALAAAHAAGIVHRDIKPGNILLGDDGSVKITDFGISRATDDVTVTKTGLIAGTPAYLAPEVAIGREPGAASDVFSLGSTLYAAVEGEPPFGLSENTLGLLHAVASGKINPPQKSGPLTGVLTALLSTDVDARPTAAKARDMLGAVARGEDPDVPPAALAAAAEAATRLVAHPAAEPTSVTGQPVVMAAPAQQPRSRTPLVFGALGVAVVLAIAVLLILNRGTEKNPGNGGTDQIDTAPSSQVVTTTTVPQETTNRPPGTRVVPPPPVTTSSESVQPTTTTTVVPTTTTTTATTTTTTSTTTPTQPPPPSTTVEPSVSTPAAG